jgi:PIN domain nuclease of toxin-antitoxin system
MSEIVVLDTHIWFWFVNEEAHRYPARMQERIETAAHVGISPVSCFEIALAHRRGRLALPCEPNDWFQQALEPSGIELLPLTPAIAAIAVDLSDVHKDPFDRLIIATTLQYQGKLASVDGLFARYAELTGLLLTDA